MTTIQRLKEIIPGQTTAWYTRIAAEIDSGRMPMPTTVAKPTTTVAKPTAVGKDYTIPILKAIGFGLLTSYFVVFVSSFVLVGTAIAAFTCFNHLEVKVDS